LVIFLDVAVGLEEMRAQERKDRLVAFGKAAAIAVQEEARSRQLGVIAFLPNPERTVDRAAPGPAIHRESENPK
jgi:hypothetical protein